MVAMVDGNVGGRAEALEADHGTTYDGKWLYTILIAIHVL